MAQRKKAALVRVKKLLNQNANTQSTTVKDLHTISKDNLKDGAFSTEYIASKLQQHKNSLLKQIQTINTLIYS